MIKFEKKNILQFLKFGIVGISNTLVSLIIYYIFLWIDPDCYLVGNVVGWAVSVANAFYWNNKYVFADKSHNFGRMVIKLGKTYLSYGATFLLSTGLLYLEVDIMGRSAVICPVLNLLVTIPLNFFLNKFWTFQ
ncbi:GtrA family protein [Harryflintia acetispora]|uniref:GtrA family protein n=1 Tax=Harryflintia acetispora TaxID=1849041 RepID=UPI001046CCC7|nr:GtrA family protein [Harryflintia acetispora]